MNGPHQNFGPPTYARNFILGSCGPEPQNGTSDIGKPEFRRAEVLEPNGPQGRVAEPPTDADRASWLESVTAGTTRDSEPLMLSTGPREGAVPHAKRAQPWRLASRQPVVVDSLLPWLRARCRWASPAGVGCGGIRAALKDYRRRSAVTCGNAEVVCTLAAYNVPLEPELYARSCIKGREQETRRRVHGSANNMSLLVCYAPR